VTTIPLYLRELPVPSDRGSHIIYCTPLVNGGETLIMGYVDADSNLEEIESSILTMFEVLSNLGAETLTIKYLVFNGVDEALSERVEIALTALLLENQKLLGKGAYAEL
jgi:hypothetical protein